MVRILRLALENRNGSSSSSSINSGGTRVRWGRVRSTRWLARALVGTREARALGARAKHARWVARAKRVRWLARAKRVRWGRVRSTRWARAKRVRLPASTSTP